MTHLSPENRSRSISVEQTTSRPSLSPRAFSSSSTFGTVPAVVGASTASFPATTTAYDSHLLTVSQPFGSLEPPWTAPYFTSQAPQLSPWIAPQWLPTVEFGSQIPVTSSNDFEMLEPQGHHVFDHVAMPPGQPHETDNNLFILGSYGHVRRHIGDPPQVSSVSPQFLPIYTKRRHPAQP